ncbi:MAG TPA: tripartite tricarboxylate transporter TctB family protein [Casimicrobiaceae bacterium]|nr:tripartite tricarboxylate transporter TctB family protein [Casimicrobiaceae bacterium]
MQRLLRSGDFWSGLVLCALGVYIVTEAQGWSYGGPDGPGPGFFPLWYGVAMIALSLTLVLRTMLARRAPRTVAWPEVRRALACWIVVMIAVASMKLIGFMLSFALLTWFIVAIMFHRSHALALVLGIGGALVFQGVFDMALGVSLPLGFGL